MKIKDVKLNTWYQLRRSPYNFMQPISIDKDLEYCIVEQIYFNPITSWVVIFHKQEIRKGLVDWYDFKKLDDSYQKILTEIYIRHIRLLKLFRKVRKCFPDNEFYRNYFSHYHKIIHGSFFKKYANLMQDLI